MNFYRYFFGFVICCTALSCSTQKAVVASDDYNNILNAYVNSGPLALIIETKKYPAFENEWSQDKETYYYKVNDTNRILIQDDQEFFYDDEKSLWINNTTKVMLYRKNDTQEERERNVKGDLLQSHIRDVLALSDSIKFMGYDDNEDRIFKLFFEKKGRKNALLTCDKKTYRTKSITIFLHDMDRGWKEVINYIPLSKDRKQQLMEKFDGYNKHNIDEIRTIYSDYVVDDDY